MIKPGKKKKQRTRNVFEGDNCGEESLGKMRTGKVVRLRWGGLGDRGAQTERR